MKNHETRTSDPEAPSSLRLGLLTWAVAWPLITILITLLQSLISGWPLPVRTLLLSGLMILLMSRWIMPLLTRRLKPWLARSGPYLQRNLNTSNREPIGSMHQPLDA